MIILISHQWLEVGTNFLRSLFLLPLFSLILNVQRKQGKAKQQQQNNSNDEGMSRIDWWWDIRFLIGITKCPQFLKLAKIHKVRWNMKKMESIIRSNVKSMNLANFPVRHKGLIIQCLSLTLDKSDLLRSIIHAKCSKKENENLEPKQNIFSWFTIKRKYPFKGNVHLILLRMQKPVEFAVLQQNTVQWVPNKRLRPCEIVIDLLINEY